MPPHRLDALVETHPPHTVQLRTLEAHLSLVDIAPQEENTAYLIVHEQPSIERLSAVYPPHAARYKLRGVGLQPQLLAQFAQGRVDKARTRWYVSRTRDIITSRIRLLGGGTQLQQHLDGTIPAPRDPQVRRAVKYAARMRLGTLDTPPDGFTRLIDYIKIFHK